MDHSKHSVFARDYYARRGSDAAPILVGAGRDCTSVDRLERP